MKIEDSRKSIEYASAIRGSRADLCETFFLEYTGVRVVKIKRIPYFAELAIDFLASYEQIFLVGAKEPVGFILPDILANYPHRMFEYHSCFKDEDVEQALQDL